MEIIYLIKDELTDEELISVLINVSLTPTLGALVTTPKGIRVAQDCSLDYRMMFNASFDQVEAEAKRLTQMSGSPIAIIGDFTESLKEIACQES